MNEKWTAAHMPDLTGKFAIVTGANSGIGLETARELARKGAQVIMACRSIARGEKARQDILRDQPAAAVEVAALDLADLASVRNFAQEIAARGRAVDILVNNAGVMAIPYRRTVDGLETQLATNHFGHFALTGLLLEQILAAPAGRVVTVSSSFHRFGSMDFENLNWEKGYQKWPAYGRSKLANLLFTFELQRRLEQMNARAIAVAAHPGYTDTNLQHVGPQMEGNSVALRFTHWMNKLMGQSAAMGALPTLYAAVAPEVRGGDFIGPDGWMESRGHPRRVQPAATARDPIAAAKLWEASEKATGVRYAMLVTV
jgi:NAD(P)-dependent dehydrogenase (short-subunit alcohol dehydrogenase family)